MGKSVHIIYNPAAGRAKRKLILAAATRLEELGMTVSIEETAGPNMASAMARNSDSDILVAAGGDGTVREVIDGMAGSDKVLAIFPMGTANVLAAEMGLKTNVDAVVRTIRYGTPQPLHLGMANDRYFAVMASIGFDADVVADVNLRLKNLIGKSAYVIAAFRKMLSFRPHSFTLNIDGVDYPCGGAIIANGQYYGGKFVCVPSARVTDAKLHACLLRASSRVDLFNYALTLVLGRFPNCPGVEIVEGRTFRIEGPKAALQADGDIIGDTPITITSEDNRRLSLVMPS